MTVDDCFNSICVPHPACCSISDFLAESCLQFKYSNCMCLYPIRILGYGYSFGSSMKKRHVLVGNNRCSDGSWLQLHCPVHKCM